MSDEYTPTTEQVREWCADDGGLAEYHDPINGHHEADRVRAMFDRWLSAHDADLTARLAAAEETIALVSEAMLLSDAPGIGGGFFRASSRVILSAYRPVAGANRD